MITILMPAINGTLDAAPADLELDAGGVEWFSGDVVEESDAGLTWSLKRSSGVGMPCAMYVLPVGWKAEKGLS